MDEPATLYCAVGEGWLDAIRGNGFAAFPPLPAGQLFFWVTRNEEHAREMARDWYAKYDSGCCGYVLRFAAPASFLTHYAAAVALGSGLGDYWVHAEDMIKLNECIAGPLEVIAEYRAAGQPESPPPDADVARPNGPQPGKPI
ncbi:MAG TPA: hypothetical protein VNO70_24380 [Blastocatellia bacterium]|nr:hypothetical protein [Blastocatellia bacterium]